MRLGPYSWCEATAAMGAPSCRLLVQRCDRQVVLRVEGRGSMLQSPAVRRFAEKCLVGGADSFRLDLRHCSYMDSTFLGTLLFLQRKHGQEGTGKFAVIAPSPECCRLLQQLGIEDLLCTVQPEDPVEATWVPLSPDVQDVAQVRANVLQAHQELAQLPGPPGEQFRAVQSCLEGHATPPSR